jgi:hypothetical protein
MKTLRHCCAVACIALLCGGCAGLYPPPPQPRSQLAPGFDPQQLNKLALLVEDSTKQYSRNPGVFRQIEDEFIYQLLAKGYSLAARSDVASVMKELKFQQSGVTEEDAAKLGRMLNVPAVLIVTITDCSLTSQETGLIINNRRQVSHTAQGKISCRLISVEKAEILWLGSHAGALHVRDKKDAHAVLAPVASQLAHGFPGRIAVPSSIQQ